MILLIVSINPSKKIKKRTDWYCYKIIGGRVMINNITPAIMIGGFGTRLWPLSRVNKPKQFLVLENDHSLFQNTVLRVQSPEFSPPWFLTNQRFMALIERQLLHIGCTAERMIIEPMQRGTAAALAAISALIAQNNPDALILAMPSDHIILNQEIFKNTIVQSVPLAINGKIVTFGIKPDAAEIGYGYIKKGEPLPFEGDILGYSVASGSFFEKPDRQTAQKFIDTGYLWNSGIFLFMASTMVSEFETYAQDTLNAVSASIKNAKIEGANGTRFYWLNALDFEKSPNGYPFDKVIMEKSNAVAVVPAPTIGWYDIGSLSALWDFKNKDENKNVLSKKSVVDHAHGNLIYSQANRSIVASHVDDLLIIDTHDTLLVMPKNQSQHVGQLFTILENKNIEPYDVNALFEWRWKNMQLISQKGSVVMVEIELHNTTLYDRECIIPKSETWVVTLGQVDFIINGVCTALTIGQSVTIEKSSHVQIKADNCNSICVVVAILDHSLNESSLLFP
jgi:mannose-1-phosphate guanylyltransferase/mannose-6-phosphate isomerase